MILFNQMKGKRNLKKVLNWLIIKTKLKKKASARQNPLLSRKKNPKHRKKVKIVRAKYSLLFYPNLSLAKLETEILENALCIL